MNLPDNQIHGSGRSTWLRAAVLGADDGRPIEKLRNILGHSSVDVTERYAHLAPDIFSPADYDAVTVDFSDPVVLNMQAHRGEKMGRSNEWQQNGRKGSPELRLSS